MIYELWMTLSMLWSPRWNYEALAGGAPDHPSSNIPFPDHLSPDVPFRQVPLCRFPSWCWARAAWHRFLRLDRSDRQAYSGPLPQPQEDSHISSIYTWSESVAI